MVYHKKPRKGGVKMCLERVLTKLALQPCSDGERAAAAVDPKEGGVDNSGFCQP